ncbi:MAG: hypothetical protein QXQ66_08030, partial [Candidatus Hadarchaeum sp.]|uniref:hypothetical protein n=1 Tax=Candidatus Hadarchaeum sp. TaxID=2883567 RepID=UPI003172A359
FLARLFDEFGSRMKRSMAVTPWTTISRHPEASVRSLAWSWLPFYLSSRYPSQRRFAEGGRCSLRGLPG